MRLTFAYLDPVTGGALMQVVLGAMAVAGLGYQYIRKGAKTLFSRFRPQESPEETSTSDTP